MHLAFGNKSRNVRSATVRITPLLFLSLWIRVLLHYLVPGSSSTVLNSGLRPLSQPVMQLAGAGLHSRPVSAAAQLHSSASTRSTPHCFKAAACRRVWTTYRNTSRRPQQVVCQAATDLAKFADQAYLDKAAKRFRLGETSTPPCSMQETPQLHSNSSAHARSGFARADTSTFHHTSKQSRSVWPGHNKATSCRSCHELSVHCGMYTLAGYQTDGYVSTHPSPQAACMHAYRAATFLLCDSVLHVIPYEPRQAPSRGVHGLSLNHATVMLTVIDSISSLRVYWTATNRSDALFAV